MKSMKDSLLFRSLSQCLNQWIFFVMIEIHSFLVQRVIFDISGWFTSRSQCSHQWIFLVITEILSSIRESVFKSKNDSLLSCSPSQCLKQRIFLVMTEIHSSVLQRFSVSISELWFTPLSSSSEIRSSFVHWFSVQISELFIYSSWVLAGCEKSFRLRNLCTWMSLNQMKGIV